MLDRIAAIVTRFNELERQMTDPAILTDHIKLTELAQERAEISGLVDAYQEYQTVQVELNDARQLRESDDPDLRDLADEEVPLLEAQLEKLTARMRTFLIPKDPHDGKNVFLEIRAGAGGDEAGIFAADIMRMYMRYAETQNWKVDLVDENSTGVGGYKEVILGIKGSRVYANLKYERGVHRVQRVPVTESQGRIHTSTVTVAVAPEVEDVDIVLDERDLEITSTFSSGPGGQHMQKNATAARVFHKPSGIMVKVQSERSLTQNKRLAMAIIQGRLQEAEDEKKIAAASADRKSQLGSGDRSEKIRTYNYPQSRVTDHRIGFHSYNLASVMDGGLEPFIEALTIADETAKLADLEENQFG